MSGAACVPRAALWWSVLALTVLRCVLCYVALLCCDFVLIRVAHTNRMHVRAQRNLLHSTSVTSLPSCPYPRHIMPAHTYIHLQLATRLCLHCLNNHECNPPPFFQAPS